jgi:hypothetical protein
MTGNVVIEDYTNETSCVDAGYLWEDTLNETCTINSDCEIGVTVCVENCCEYLVVGQECNNSSYDNQEDCAGNSSNWGDTLNETCTINSDCVGLCEIDCCVYEVIGGQCTGDVCDVDNLNLCSDETTCDGATGYWYGGICNAGACVPDTCEDLGCGIHEDGCGGILNDCPVCLAPTKAPPKEVKSSCVSQWECTIWEECIDGTQTRTCEDTRNCVLKEGEPSLSQSCGAIFGETLEEETCFDGTKNQDEEGVDCGGVCEARCSGITGGAISPIESGKEFFRKNKTIVIIISLVLVLALAGFLTFGVLKKKDFIPKVSLVLKDKMSFLKNLIKPKPREVS